ncbi:MAG: SpoIIE family protein phosphatase [Desulfobacterales bacterium]
MYGSLLKSNLDRMAEAGDSTRRPLRIKDENAALRAILEGTATDTGERFFESLVENLANALGTYAAWVTEYIEDTRQLRALAFWVDGQLAERFLIDIDGTPCQAVIETTDLVHYPDRILNFYPHSASLKDFHAVSYMGLPLLDRNRKVLGNLAVLDRRTMPMELRALAVLQIFADRASAELQRLRAEAGLKKSEEKYRRIIETTGESFLLLDRKFFITDANDAFCRLVGYPREEIIGRTPLDFATNEFKRFLTANRENPLAYRLDDVEGALVSRTGRRIPIRIYGDILLDDSLESMGFMYFIIDITQQKRSLALAGEVQRALLPQQAPGINGFEIAGRTWSCDEIGGDYFDYLLEEECEQPHLDVIVGDVTGHGVEAALLMTTARAFLRMQTKAAPCSPISRIITEMNRNLVQEMMDSGWFMTLFALRIDLGMKQVQWVRAGHPSAVVYDPLRDQFRELRGEGIALGMDGEAVYSENVDTASADGQVIAIGTDGIWEALDRNGFAYGKERLRRVIRGSAHRGADAILGAVFEDLKAFSAGVVQEDDITLVIVKVGDRRHPPTDFQI